MALPRFSDILVARRRELGLTVAQASKVLKLKEQVLIAFEEGDFDNIPKSGYAQGMLSSYARYLGLNPREIVDQFQEDLYEYSYGTSSHELRRRTRASRSGDLGLSRSGVLRPGQTGRMSLTEGPTGRLSTYPDFSRETPSYFDTTSVAHSRTTGRPASTPLTGSRIADQRSSEARGYEYETDPYSGNRRYTGRPPQSTTTRVRPRGSVHTPDDTAALAVREAERRGGYRSGDVYTRSTDGYSYVDDLVYDEEPMPYEAASTVSGRRSSRNIASTERPNVTRSSTASDRRRLAARRNQRRQPEREGIVGTILDFFSDSRRAAIVVLGLVAIILTFIIIGSVRSCVAARNTTGRQVATTDPNQVVVTTSSAANTPDTADEPTTADSPTEPQPITETNVVVSLADGQVSWIEIECDGSSIVADTINGPWEQSFVVRQGINVQVGDTSVVTVTRNGEKVQFTTKASGVGTLYIEGTDPEAAAAQAQAEAESQEGESSEG